MTDNTDKNNSSHPARREMFCGRSTGGGLFCGLMLLVMGAVLIAKKTGLIPLDMSLFWPSAMVLAGTWILAAALLKRRRSS